MKRLLSFLLSLTIILTLIPCVSAASNEAVAAANALYEQGLFKGTGTNADGTPIFDLDKTPTRNQAIIMLVRLLGKEDEALSGTWDIPFIDVSENMRPYIGYAYQNGLTSGTSATTYSGSNPISANQYIAFVLRSLGYNSGTDFAVSAATTLSNQLGITKGEYDNVDHFTRGDVAIISNRSLSIENKINASKSSKLSAEMLQGTWYNWNRTSISSETTFSEKKEITFSGNDITIAQYDDEIRPGKICFQYGTGTYSIDDNGIYPSYSYHMYPWYSDTMDIEKPHTGEYWRVEIISQDKIAIGKFLSAPPADYNFEWDPQENVYIRVYSPTVTNFVKSELDKRLAEADNQSGNLSSNPSTTSNYAYLVASDFRSVRRKYSEAVAQCGYALAFTDLNGDNCVLTTIQYKIISNYNITVLHNLTQNKTIEDPANYYNNQAKRAFGGNKLFYWDLCNEVLTHYQEMLKAMSSVLKGGSNTGRGTFVSSDILNQ